MIPKMLLALKESNSSIVVEWSHKMVYGDTIIFRRIRILDIWTFNSRVSILSSTTYMESTR
jgi:hypothetical protein